jgi:hypothetical protein
MRQSRATTPDGSEIRRDIGTLWTLSRGESMARCALLALGVGLELRVLLDGDVLKAERCGKYEEAFDLAERWRGRMIDRGWVSVRR